MTSNPALELPNRLTNSMSLPNIKDIYKPQSNIYKSPKHSESRHSKDRMSQSIKDLRKSFDNLKVDQTLISAKKEKN